MAALLEKSLAKEIRESTESEQFDLANYDQQQSNDLVRSAFAEPLSVPEMVRFTFLVGGGKNSRQRYDPNLTKYLCGALREIGFSEDRAASTDLACQGTFKQQHDTDKNVKTLHVFPRVELTSAGDGAAEEAGSGGGGPSLSHLGSPGYLATVCEFETMKKMVASKTQSWAQRRRLLADVREVLAQFRAVEAKMMSAQPLAPEEEELYNVTSAEDIEERVAWLEAQLKKMVDDGQISMGEKQQLLEQVEQKLAAVADELAAAEADNKPKRAEKLLQVQANLNARKDRIDAVLPIRHPLKHEVAIMQLWKEVIPLEKLEATKGRLLTMEEMRRIGARPDLEDEIAELQEQSKGWFEDDAEFQARCDAIRATAVARAAKAAKAKAAKKSSKPTRAEDEWETVGSIGAGRPTGGARRGKR